MTNLTIFMLQTWGALPEVLRFVVVTTLKIFGIVLPLIIVVAYYTYAERKVIAFMHARMGPNRVGPMGILQPIADTLKMLLKEVIVPANANRFLFVLAPVIS